MKKKVVLLKLNVKVLTITTTKILYKLIVLTHRYCLSWQCGDIGEVYTSQLPQQSTNKGQQLCFTLLSIIILITVYKMLMKRMIQI